MSVSIGDRFGPYLILDHLGEGGMGEVWKARDTRLDRVVAIKRLKGQHSARFEQEARAIAALNHPNICVLYDVGPDYLVMEYVDGKPLGGPLPCENALRIAIQIARALDAAHQRGILHRDLKPANILITPAGVKLLDFGLAKLMGEAGGDETQTAEGTVLGTAAYMSPEQAQGKPLDERSDIFSAGSVLYELLSGRRAFQGKSVLETLNAVICQEPGPLESPAADIVKRCMAKNPAQRFQSAAELNAALDQCQAKPPDRNPSIAVLPFANMSADKENEYFGDGLAEEIINALANVAGVNVTARTSSFFFRGKDVEFVEIGRRLNVQHILEGSVRKAGDRIRVTAQLIKVSDGFHIWSERYDRVMTDIFAIQDEITQAIAGALRIKLSVEDAPRRHVPHLRAYEAYIKARQHWLNPTPESLARVKEFLDHAIELDPKFALAHSLLGGYYSFLAGFGIAAAREVIPLACAAELEALRIDPSLAEAHALLGCWAGGYDHDWNAAERRWRLAMAHEPVSHDVRFWYGNHYLAPMGRVAEAVEIMARALQEDPLNLLYRSILARGLRQAGRLPEAEAELRKVLEIDETFPPALGTLGAVCAQQGRFQEALTLTERACAITPWENSIKGQLAALLVRSGDKSRADALIQTLGSGDASGTSAGLAVYYAMCGDLDRAAEWAGRAIEQRYPPLIAILKPLLGSSPQWPPLAKLMNLPG
jgi:serine/threonine-protein kinase